MALRISPKASLTRASWAAAIIALPSLCAANIIDGGYGVSASASSGVYAQNQVGYILQLENDGPLKTVPSSTRTATIDNLGAETDEYSNGFNFTTNMEEFLPIIWASSMMNTAQATAGMGVLHLYSSARATLSPGTYLYNDLNGSPHLQINPLRAWASGEAKAESQDTLTITSGSLPAGSPVDIRTTLRVHGSVSGGPGTSEDVTAYLRVGRQGVGQMTNPDPLAPNQGSVFAIYQEILDDRGDMVTDYPSSLIHTFVGDQLTFSLIGVAHSNVPSGVVNGIVSDLSSQADLGNTILLNFDPVTPDTSFTAQSGALYFTPAPEPASAAMLLGGLVLFLTRAKRQRIPR